MTDDRFSEDNTDDAFETTVKIRRMGPVILEETITPEGAETRQKQANQIKKLDFYPFFAITEDNTNAKFSYNIQCTKSEFRITIRD